MSRHKKAILKVIILGDSGVGKTSLMQRFCKDQFSQKYKATIGADTMTKEVQIGEKLVTLQIWDTAGQERFQSLGTSFYRGADACVLVYDITDSKSFDNVSTWKEDFLNTAGPKNAKDFPFVVLGNKKDLENRRQVAFGKVKQWVQTQEQKDMPAVEASAKEATNVAQAFNELAAKALANSASRTPPMIPKTINVNPTKEDADKSCC